MWLGLSDGQFDDLVGLHVHFINGGKYAEKMAPPTEGTPG
jgi:hypothetical protein